MSAALKSLNQNSGAYVYSGHDDEDATRNALPELSLVTLIHAVTTYDGESVGEGSIGTIVGVYGDGSSYEIEFTSPHGIAAVRSEDVAPK